MMCENKLLNAVVEQRWDDVVMSLHNVSSSHSSSSSITTVTRQINAIERESRLNVLQLACFYRAPTNVIRVILSLSNAKTMMAQRGDRGRTPLMHYICHRSLSSPPSSSSLERTATDDNNDEDDIIVDMVDAYPNAVSILDKSRLCPLNAAITYGRSLRIINHLAMVYPKVMAVGKSLRETPLIEFYQGFNMIIRKALDVTMETTGKELDISMCISKYHNFIRNNHDIAVRDKSIGWVVDVATIFLRVLAVYNLSWCSVKIAAATIPEVVVSSGLLPKVLPWEEKKESFQFRPLHVALTVSAFPGSFFRVMVQHHFRDEVYQCDDNGNYPLHVAATMEMSWDGDLYRCCECRSQLGDVPWFYCENFFNQTYCQMCFKGSRENPVMYGHVYSIINPVEKMSSAIGDILAVDKTMASIPNSDNRLPLSLAAENGMTFHYGRRDGSHGDWGGNAKSIFEACPMSLTTPDVKTHLYPFQLAATKKKTGGSTKYSSFSSCYAMLMECPYLLDVGKVTTSSNVRKRKRCH